MNQILYAFLATQGQHEAAQRALDAKGRGDWVRLTDVAIRTAPDYDRDRVAQELYLELDRPQHGGTGEAADFIMREEPHPFHTGHTWWKAYRADTGAYVNIASQTAERLKSTLIGRYVVRGLKTEAM